MGKRKITCKNSGCKHHEGDGCDTCIELDAYGRCNTFEKGIFYYFHIVWDALGNSNFIDAIKVNEDPDIRIGMYYIMECYGVCFSTMDWGNCRMFMFTPSEDGDSLHYDDIVSRDFNIEKFKYHKDRFNQGILPGNEESDCKSESAQIDSIEKEDIYGGEYGWLSPDAEWISGDFGDHEKIAQDIIMENQWNNDFEEFKNSKKGVIRLSRDFLIEEKDYALLHNPLVYGSANVQCKSKISEPQRKWLHDYYLLHDPIKASQYEDGNL